MQNVLKGETDVTDDENDETYTINIRNAFQARPGY